MSKDLHDELLEVGRENDPDYNTYDDKELQFVVNDELTEQFFRELLESESDTFTVFNLTVENDMYYTQFTGGSQGYRGKPRKEIYLENNMIQETEEPEFELVPDSEYLEELRRVKNL